MSLEALLTGAGKLVRQFDGPQTGRVSRLAGRQLYLTLDAFPDVELGPCAWSRPSSTAGTPPVGTAVLVLFPGSGADAPWVAGFDGWPA